MQIEADFRINYNFPYRYARGISCNNLRGYNVIQMTCAITHLVVDGLPGVPGPGGRVGHHAPDPGGPPGGRGRGHGVGGHGGGAAGGGLLEGQESKPGR